MQKNCWAHYSVCVCVCARARARAHAPVSSHAVGWEVGEILLRKAIPADIRKEDPRIQGIEAGMDSMSSSAWMAYVKAEPSPLSF